MVDSNGPKILAALWAMTAISFFFMALRFFCKAAFTKRIGTDDALLLLSWFLSVSYAAFITVSVNYGLGKHGVDISPENKVGMTKFLFIGEFFALIAIPTSKTSFAVTLLRIVSKLWQKSFIWFTIVTMNVVMWLCAILLLFQCQPIQRNWDKSRPGSCWESSIQDNYSIFAAVYSAFLDFVLATFPCLLIYNLQMGKREKIGVICAMSLGFLAGITAAVKTRSLPGIGHFQDSSFELANLLIWSIAETSVTIVAASIPFFRVLIKHVSTGGDSSMRRQSYKLDTYRSRHKSGVVELAPRDDESDVSLGEDRLPIQGIIVKDGEVNVEHALK